MGRSLACLGAVARWGGGVLGRLIQAHLGMDNGELARPEVLRARELAPLHHARVDMGPILKESAGSAADARGEVVPCEHKIARDRTGSHGGIAARAMAWAPQCAPFSASLEESSIGAREALPE